MPLSHFQLLPIARTVPTLHALERNENEGANYNRVHLYRTIRIKNEQQSCASEGKTSAFDKYAIIYKGTKTRRETLQKTGKKWKKVAL